MKYFSVTISLFCALLFCFPAKVCSEKPHKPFHIPLYLNTDSTLKILTWNIFMLPFCNLLNRNHHRAKLIAESIMGTDYDIIVFQEAFDKGSRNIIKQKLMDEFPYIYGPANISGFTFRTSSGVWVLSKIPLRKIKEIKYNSRFGMDAMAQKGAVLFEGDFNGNLFQLMGTHLQADSPDKFRINQCAQIKTELLEKYANRNIPQILCGDFNIDTYDKVNYTYMLTELDAENSLPEGDIGVSYDEVNNSLVHKENGSRQLIDYVLLRNFTNRKIMVKRNISVFRVKNQNNTLVDLSDHYAVAAVVKLK